MWCTIEAMTFSADDAFVNPPATADVPSRRITRIVTARATPERVWRAITAPEDYARWLGDIATFPNGFTEGATGRFAWTGEIVLAVEVQRVEPMCCIAFSWAEGFISNAATTVTISIRPDDLGTQIHLEESGFAFDGAESEAVLRSLRSLAQGWTLELDELVKLVEADEAA